MYIIFFFNIKHHPGFKLVFPIPDSQGSQQNAFAQLQENRSH